MKIRASSRRQLTKNGDTSFIFVVYLANLRLPSSVFTRRVEGYYYNSSTIKQQIYRFEATGYCKFLIIWLTLVSHCLWPLALIMMIVLGLVLCPSSPFTYCCRLACRLFHWFFLHPVFTVLFVLRCWRNVYRVLAFPLRWYCFFNAHVWPVVHIKHSYLRMPLHWLFRLQSRMLCLAFRTIYISPTIFFHPTSLPILLLDYMISLFVFLLRFDEGRQRLFVKT